MSPAGRRLLNCGLLACLAGLSLAALALAWPRADQAAPPPFASGKSTPGQPAAGDPGRDLFAPPVGLEPQLVREAPLEALGVVIGPGETMALVRHGTITRRLRPGDTVGRYRLQEVHADRLVFRGPEGDQTREVPLKKKSPPGQVSKKRQ